MFQAVRDWVVDRFALMPIYKGLLDRRVPRASWYAGDGSTLMGLLGLQVFTGAVLMLSYTPSIESAHASVTYITEQVTFGWFVRGLHYWSAGAMVIMLFFHLFRQLLLGGYKSPREGTWIIGVLLLVCVLLMAYTGYLLRWDERAVYGIRVMLHMLVRVPLIGETLVLLVQGGPELGPRTLTQLYAFHVFIIPLAMFLLLGFHLYLVVQRGTMTRSEREVPPLSSDEQRENYKREAAGPRGQTFFPETMMTTGLMATVVLGAVVTAALLVGPSPVGEEANLIRPSTPAEEWWFWWYSGLIALLPPSIAPWFVVVFPVVSLLALLALPFLDRSPARGIRRRPLWAMAVVLMVVALLALSDYRRRSAFTGWPDPEPPAIPAGMQLTPDAEAGRHLFAQFGCTSCHPVAGQGQHVAVDITKIDPVRSRTYIRDYILNPPDGIAMPSYAGRLSDEQLAGLIEFCHEVQTFPRR